MFAKTIVFAAGVATVSAACSGGVQFDGTNPIYKPATGDLVTAGVPVTVDYDGRGLSGTLTFHIYGGTSQSTLTQKGDAAVGIQSCGADHCTFTWTPSADLDPSLAVYGLQLQDDSSCKFQWSTPFTIKAGTAKSSSAAPPASSSKAAPVSSASGSYSKPAPYSSKSGAPYPSGSGYPKPSGWAKPSGYPDDEPCESDYPTHWSTKYAPAPTGGYTPKTNATGYQPAGNPLATYKPLQANDAGRFTVGAAGAVVALAAAVMLL